MRALSARRRTTADPFSGMPLPLQIDDLIGPEGGVVQQCRGPKGIVGKQFVKDLDFSQARSQGLKRGCKFRLSQLIHLRVGAYRERCHGKECGIDKEKSDLGVRLRGVSSQHVLVLLINPRSCARHPGICSWRWPKAT